MGRKPQALIFDVDGTLADTEKDGHRVAFNAAFKQAELSWHWDVPLYGELLTVTGGKERIRHYIDKYKPEVPELVNQSLDEFIAQLHQAKTAHYTDMLAAGNLPLRPGVRRLIDEAREMGMRMAIATTTTPVNVMQLLTHSLAPGSETWFEVIAAGDIVPAKKPAPDIYHYTLEKLGLGAEECIAFEDSHNGVRSALDAGVPVIATVNGYTEKEDFTGAVLVLDNLGEPDEPFNVIAGDVGSSTFVDLGLIQRLVDE